MKLSRHVLTFLFIICITPFVYSADLGDVYLRFISGDIQLRPAGESEWVAGAVNVPLQAGDQIWVPDDSKAELMFRNGTLLRLGQDSSLEIVALRKDQTQLYLGGGHAYVNWPGSKGHSIVLETPGPSVRTSRASIFKADVSESGDVDISVVKGETIAEQSGHETTIAAGERVLLEKDVAEVQRTALLALDEWDQWNMQRDGEFFAPASSAKYLPEELAPYGPDFDQYGQWVSTPDYGYVWAPSVVDDWAPYSSGYWGWIGAGYVWMPCEPWGWAPFHYGRWIYAHPFGWGWVPPRRGHACWGPGYVGWVHTPNRVSWVPLGPRDTYYGYGHYGPRSVNITGAGSLRDHVTNQFTNAHVQNAVTTVSADAFLKGQPGATRIQENPFLKTQSAVMGAPRTRPALASTATGSQEVAQARLSRGRMTDFQARGPTITSRGTAGLSGSPVQVGDVFVWKSTSANGAQTYVVSNMPQRSRQVDAGQTARTSPAQREGLGPPLRYSTLPRPSEAATTHDAASRSAGQETFTRVTPSQPGALGAGNQRADRGSDRSVRSWATSDLARSSLATPRVDQRVSQTQHFSIGSGRPAGMSAAHSVTPRTTSGFSGVSSHGSFSHGSSRGSGGRGSSGGRR